MIPPNTDFHHHGWVGRVGAVKKENQKQKSPMRWVLSKGALAIGAGTAISMAIVASAFNSDHPNHVYRPWHSRLPCIWDRGPLRPFSSCHVLLFPGDKLRSKPTSYSPRGI